MFLVLLCRTLARLMRARRRPLSGDRGRDHGVIQGSWHDPGCEPEQSLAHHGSPVALIRLVLAHMRAQGGGAIVQMSSVGGQITAPGFGAYCATKFALEGLTQAFNDEVASFGIRALIVEPGAFRTGLFRPDAAYQSDAMPEYAATVGPTRAYVNGNNGLQPGDPAKAAQAILSALDADEPPLRLVLGGDAIDNIRARLDQLTAELTRWEAVGRQTAIEGPA
jgi:NAD(P)-dependent dehydrogenase (short-subunit alcohol dehydrogenase family)